MSERPFARIDGVAWILLSSGLLVSLSLLSYDAGESNLLGRPGNWISRELFATFGAAAYALLASWFVVILVLLLRKGWLLWLKRLAGWAILVPSAAVAAEWFAGDLLGQFPQGPGGWLGALLAGQLVREFNVVGGWFVFAGLAFAGLWLALDFFLIQSWNTFWDACSACGDFVARLLAWCVPAPKPETEAPKATSAKRGKKPLVDPAIIPISHSGVRLYEAPAEEEIPEVPEPSILRLDRPAEETVAEDTRPVYDDFELPGLNLLEESEPFPYQQHDQRLRDQATLLEKTFQDFALNIRVVGINTGPVITQYEITLETGMRVNKITGLADDLALHLRVPSVRIVAPIPGKNTVGIEVPNEKRANVRLKELIVGGGKKLQKSKLPLFLGKDTEGRPLIFDLAEMPHLLIAGTTGTGKSVCLNAIITSMLMTRRPDEVKMILIDPKMTEMTEYGKIPHLMHPVVTDMKKAEAILAWAVDKMEQRYDQLSKARVRNIATYNELGHEELRKRTQPQNEAENKAIMEKMPYIIIVVDELADLMMMMKREVETHIIRLAQKSRAAGIHLVVATQKPTVDVITGLIKSNLPGRICFKVSSRSDSRVVLDEMGADKLLGKGDMLFLQPGTSVLIRSQGTFVSDAEISKVVEHLQVDEPCFEAELVHLKTKDEEDDDDVGEKIKARDELYEGAVDIVVREGRGSVSLLQRALGIGYGRAARLIDYMAEDGIVGAYKGSNAREVLLEPERWQAMKDDPRAASS